MAYRTLRAVLFETGTTLDSALRDEARGTAVPLRQDLGYGVRAFLVESRSGRPSWLDYLEDGASGSLPALLNQSNGSVVLVDAVRNGVSRVIAYTFGNGRTLLALDRIEHDFGLRVVVNSVDPDRLRRVETKVFEDLVLHTARQVSRHSPTVTFSIDDSRDLVRAVAGEPRDRDFARRIAGSDSLAISSEASFDRLGELAADLLARYESDAFREDFGFIEQVRPVRDAAKIGLLNDLLEQDLVQGPLADLRAYLAPPEIIDFDKVDGFLYHNERRGSEEPHPDLDLADYLAVTGRANATIANLKKQRIRAVDGGGAEFDAWTAYSCLIYEVKDAGQLYMLSEGQWFHVQADFAAGVDAEVAAVDRIDLGWRDGKAHEAERDYNEDIVKSDPTLGLFDRVAIQIPGQRTPIEACDVLGDHRLIHVKRRTSSATLSHLFAQGRVSADSFRWIPGVRQQMREHLGSAHQLTATIPVDEPGQREFTVVFAVLAKNAAKLPGDLPFFSKLNLVRTARDVRRAGYEVRFAAIQQDD